VYRLKRKWEKCSPAILIQSLWKRYLVRKDIKRFASDRDKSAVLIQKVYRG
jgi:hypothetical protein